MKFKLVNPNLQLEVWNRSIVILFGLVSVEQEQERTPVQSTE